MPPQFAFVSVLYYLAFFLLVLLAIFVYRRNPKSPLHRTFALADLSLLAWLLTLFLYYRESRSDQMLTLVGRLNFASAACVALLALLFIREIIQQQEKERHYAERPVTLLLVAETAALSLVTILTPLIDRAERFGVTTTATVVGTLPPPQHETDFGPLFPLYVLHIALYLGAALFVAGRTLFNTATPSAIRRQIAIVGMGVAATSVVSITTNLLLPFRYGVFTYQEVGALSTLLFIGASLWAIFAYRLFDIRLIVRRTLVYGLLLSFVLAAYSSVAYLVTDYLAGKETGAFTKFGVLVIAFSFDPLRRFLESQIDRLLFPDKVTDKFADNDKSRKRRASSAERGRE